MMLEPFGFDHYLLAMFTKQLPDYKWFFFAITQLGSPLTLTMLATLGFVLGKNRVKVFSVVLLIGLLFSIVVVDDLKEIAQRPRPDVARSTDFLILDSYSFPSGHAFSIFLAVSILGAYYGWRYYAAGYVLAIAVSLSRLYLGVHYPSDILAGAVLGIAMGELVVYAAYRFGLCESRGLSSLSHPIKAKQAWNIKPDNVLSVSVFFTILLATVLYYMDYGELTIFILTVAAMMVILYIMATGIQYDRDKFTAFVILAICLISAVSMLYLGAFLLSFITIAVAYVAIISIKVRREKANKV